jgi:hypothetical protein
MKPKTPPQANDSTTYDRAFRDIIRTFSEPANLVTDVIVRRLKKDGIDADVHRDAIVQVVAARLASHSPGKAEIEFNLDGILDTGTKRIQISADELNEAADRLTKAVEEASPALFSDFSENALKSVLSDPDRRLLDLEIERDGFVRRLAFTWSEPLRLLDIQVALCGEIGESWNETLRRKRRRSKDLIVVDVITRLHGRAMAVAGEIQVLLRNGFADGAMSRWRTIHELAVTAMFVSEHGPEVARRFAEHVGADSVRSARQYQKHASALGYSPLPKKELQRLQKLEDGLVTKYGKQFLEDYGWAAGFLNGQKPNFANVESMVNLDKLRPYFRLASNTVHAGAKGTFFRLGIIGESDMILAGASNAGLEEAGRLLAHSLSQITAVLLMLHPNTDGLVWGRALLELSNKVELQFLKVKRKLEREEEELRRSGLD